MLVGQDLKHVPAYVSGVKNVTYAWCQKMFYASSIKGSRSQNFLCSDLRVNYLSWFQFSGCFLANFSFLQLSLKYIAFPKWIIYCDYMQMVELKLSSFSLILAFIHTQIKWIMKCLVVHSSSKSEFVKHLDFQNSSDKPCV